MNAVLRALILDLDGTIADTLPLCIAAFRRSVGVHAGAEPDESAVRALFGVSEEGMFARMLGAEQAEAATATYLEEYRRLHRGGLRPFAGFDELLGDASRAGVRLGVVSGKGAESLGIALQELEVGHHFEDVASGSTERCVKADQIRALVERWEVLPSCTAYVGDAPSDVTAARRAGVVAIGAAWSPGTDAEALVRAGADRLFDDFGEFAAWVRVAVARPA